MQDASEDSTTATSIQFSVASSIVGGVCGSHSGTNSSSVSSRARPVVAATIPLRINEIQPAAQESIKSTLAAPKAAAAAAMSPLNKDNQHRFLSPQIPSSFPPALRAALATPPASTSTSVSYVEAPIVLHPSRAVSPSDASLLFVESVAKLDTPHRTSLSNPKQLQQQKRQLQYHKSDLGSDRESGQSSSSSKVAGGRYHPCLMQRAPGGSTATIGSTGPAKGKEAASIVTNQSVTSSRGSIDFQEEDVDDAPPSMQVALAAAASATSKTPTELSAFQPRTATLPTAMRADNEAVALKGPFPQGAADAQPSNATSSPSLSSPPPPLQSPLSLHNKNDTKISDTRERAAPGGAPRLLVPAVTTSSLPSAVGSTAVAGMGAATSTKSCAGSPPSPRHGHILLAPGNGNRDDVRTTAVAAALEKLNHDESRDTSQHQQLPQPHMPSQHQRTYSLYSPTLQQMNHIVAGSGVSGKNLNRVAALNRATLLEPTLGGPLHGRRVSSASVQPEDDLVYCTVSDMTNAASVRGVTSPNLAVGVTVTSAAAAGADAGASAVGDNFVSSRCVSILPLVASAGRREQSFDMSLDELNALLSMNTPRDIQSGSNGKPSGAFTTASQLNFAVTSAAAATAATSTPSPAALSPSPTHLDVLHVMPLPTFSQQTIVQRFEAEDQKAAGQNDLTPSDQPKLTATAAADTVSTHAKEDASPLVLGPNQKNGSSVCVAYPPASFAQAGEEDMPSKRRRRSGISSVLSALGGKSLLCRPRSSSIASKSGTEDNNNSNNNEFSSTSLRSRQSTAHSIASGFSRMSSQLKRGARKVISARRPAEDGGASTPKQQVSKPSKQAAPRADAATEMQTLVGTTTSTTMAMAPLDAPALLDPAAWRERKNTDVLPNVLFPTKLQPAQSTPTRGGDGGNQSSSVDGSIDFHTDVGETTKVMWIVQNGQNGQTRPTASASETVIHSEEELSIPKLAEEGEGQTGGLMKNTGAVKKSNGMSARKVRDERKKGSCGEKYRGSKRRHRHHRSGRHRSRSPSPSQSKVREPKRKRRDQITSSDASNTRSSSASATASSFSDYSASSDASYTSMTSKELRRQKKKERRQRRRQRREQRRKDARGIKDQTSRRDNNSSDDKVNERYGRHANQKWVVFSGTSSGAASDDGEVEQRNTKMKRCCSHRKDYAKAMNAKRDKESVAVFRKHPHHQLLCFRAQPSSRLCTGADHLYDAAANYVRRCLRRFSDGQGEPASDNDEHHQVYNESQEQKMLHVHRHQGIKTGGVGAEEQRSSAAQLAARRRAIMAASRVHSTVDHFRTAWHRRRLQRQRVWQQQREAYADRRRKWQQVAEERQLRSHGTAIAAAVATAASRSASRSWVALEVKQRQQQQSGQTLKSAVTASPAAGVAVSSQKTKAREHKISSLRRGVSATRRLDMYEASLTSDIVALDGVIEKMRRHGLWAETSPTAAAAAAAAEKVELTVSTTRNFEKKENAGEDQKIRGLVTHDRNISGSVNGPTLPSAAAGPFPKPFGAHHTFRMSPLCCSLTAGPLAASASTLNAHLDRLRRTSRVKAGSEHSPFVRSKDRGDVRGDSSPAPRKPPANVYAPSLSVSSSMHNASLYEQQLHQPRRVDQRDVEPRSKLSGGSDVIPPAAAEATSMTTAELQERYEKLLDDMMVDARKQRAASGSKRHATSSSVTPSNCEQGNIHVVKEGGTLSEVKKSLPRSQTAFFRGAPTLLGPSTRAEMEEAEARRCAEALRAEYYQLPQSSLFPTTNQQHQRNFILQEEANKGESKRYSKVRDIGDAADSVLKQIEKSYAQALRPSCSVCRPQSFDEYVTLGLLSMLHGTDGQQNAAGECSASTLFPAGRAANENTEATVSKEKHTAQTLLRRRIRDELYAPPPKRTQRKDGAAVAADAAAATAPGLRAATSAIGKKSGNADLCTPIPSSTSASMLAAAVAGMETSKTVSQPEPYPFTPSLSFIFGSLRVRLANAEHHARRVLVNEEADSAQALHRQYVIETICVLRALRVKEQLEDRENEKARARLRQQQQSLSLLSFSSSRQQSEEKHLVHEPVTPAIAPATPSPQLFFEEDRTFQSGTCQQQQQQLPYSVLWRVPGSSADITVENSSDDQSSSNRGSSGSSCSSDPEARTWRGTTPPPLHAERLEDQERRERRPSVGADGFLPSLSHPSSGTSASSRVVRRSLQRSVAPLAHSVVSASRFTGRSHSPVSSARTGVDLARINGNTSNRGIGGPAESLDARTVLQSWSPDGGPPTMPQLGGREKNSVLFTAAATNVNGEDGDRSWNNDSGGSSSSSSPTTERKTSTSWSTGSSKLSHSEAAHSTDSNASAARNRDSEDHRDAKRNNRHVSSSSRGISERRHMTDRQFCVESADKATTILTLHDADWDDFITCNLKSSSTAHIIPPEKSVTQPIVLTGLDLVKITREDVGPSNIKISGAENSVREPSATATHSTPSSLQLDYHTDKQKADEHEHQGDEAPSSVDLHGAGEDNNEKHEVDRKGEKNATKKKVDSAVPATAASGEFDQDHQKAAGEVTSLLFSSSASLEAAVQGVDVKTTTVNENHDQSSSSNSKRSTHSFTATETSVTPVLPAPSTMTNGVFIPLEVSSSHENAGNNIPVRLLSIHCGDDLVNSGASFSSTAESREDVAEVGRDKLADKIEGSEEAEEQQAEDNGADAAKNSEHGQDVPGPFSVATEAPPSLLLNLEASTEEDVCVEQESHHFSGHSCTKDNEKGKNGFGEQEEDDEDEKFEVHFGVSPTHENTTVHRKSEVVADLVTNSAAEATLFADEADMKSGEAENERETMLAVADETSEEKKAVAGDEKRVTTLLLTDNVVAEEPAETAYSNQSDGTTPDTACDVENLPLQDSQSKISPRQSPRRRVRFSLPLEHAHKHADCNQIETEEGQKSREDDGTHAETKEDADGSERAYPGKFEVHEVTAVNDAADVGDVVTPEKLAYLSAQHAQPPRHYPVTRVGADIVAEHSESEQVQEEDGDDSVSEKTAVDLLEKLNGLDALLLYKFPSYFISGTDVDGLPGAVMRPVRDTYTPRRASVQTAPTAPLSIATCRSPNGAINTAFLTPSLPVQSLGHGELPETATLTPQPAAVAASAIGPSGDATHISQEEASEGKTERQAGDDTKSVVLQENSAVSELAVELEEAKEGESLGRNALINPKPIRDNCLEPHAFAAYANDAVEGISPSAAVAPPLPSSSSCPPTHLAPPRLPKESLASHLRRKYGLRPPPPGSLRHTPLYNHSVINPKTAPVHTTTISVGAASSPDFQLDRPTRVVPTLPSSLSAYTPDSAAAPSSALFTTFAAAANMTDASPTKRTAVKSTKQREAAIDTKPVALKAINDDVKAMPTHIMHPPAVGISVDPSNPMHTATVEKLRKAATTTVEPPPSPFHRPNTITAVEKTTTLLLDNSNNAKRNETSTAGAKTVTPALSAKALTVEKQQGQVSKGPPASASFLSVMKVPATTPQHTVPPLQPGSGEFSLPSSSTGTATQLDSYPLSVPTSEERMRASPVVKSTRASHWF